MKLLPKKLRLRKLCCIGPLSSHATIPTAECAAEGGMSLSYPAAGCCPTQTTVKQKLLFLFCRTFLTNPALDITVIACDNVSSCAPLVNLSKGEKGPLGVEQKVYILGITQDMKPSSAKSSNGEAWLPGSAGFNEHGEFAFMVCEPRRLATKNASYECKAACSQHAVKQSGVTRREILHWIDNQLQPDVEKSPRSAKSEEPRSTKSEDPRSPKSDDQVESRCPSHHHHHPHHHHVHHHHLNLPDSDLEIVVPCAYADSPRSCCSSGLSSGLNPRQPGVSYPATPSTKSSPRSSPCRQRTSPNPRVSGVSYSVSPTRSVASARSRMSSPRSSRTRRSSGRSSPCCRLPSPSPCSSSGKRSPRPRASRCCLGSPRNRYEGEAEHEKFEDFINSPEFEPPPLPLSGSSSEEDASVVAYSQTCPHHRGRARSVAATRKQIFKGPSCRPVRARISSDDCGASDGELYLGVGYMKHTHVSRNKACQKVGLPGYTVWHH